MQWQITFRLMHILKWWWASDSEAIKNLEQKNFATEGETLSVEIVNRHDDCLLRCDKVVRIELDGLPLIDEMIFKTGGQQTLQIIENEKTFLLDSNYGISKPFLERKGCIHNLHSTANIPLRHGCRKQELNWRKSWTIITDTEYENEVTLLNTYREEKGAEKFVSFFVAKPVPSSRIFVFTSLTEPCDKLLTLIPQRFINASFICLHPWLHTLYKSRPEK